MRNYCRRLFYPTVFLVLFFIVFTLPKSSFAGPDVRLGGYMQGWMHYSYEEDQKPREDVWGYRLRRARLAALTRITDDLSASTWLEFAGSQNTLLDFHFDYRFAGDSHIRVGQFRPHGQPYDTGVLGSAGLIFAERPPITTFLASNMGFDAFRDIGLMVYGNYDQIYYAIHATNGHGRFTQAGTNISQRSFGSGSYGGRLDIDITENLLIGGHASLNQQRDVVLNQSEPYDIDRYSASLRIVTDELLLSRFTTQSEFIIGSRDDDAEFSYDGLYTEIGYNLQEDLQLLTRLDYLAERPTGNGDDDLTRAVTLGAMKLFHHNDSEVARILANYNIAQLPDDQLRHMATLVLQVRFIP